MCYNTKYDNMLLHIFLAILCVKAVDVCLPRNIDNDNILLLFSSYIIVVLVPFQTLV